MKGRKPHPPTPAPGRGSFFLAVFLPSWAKKPQLNLFPAPILGVGAGGGGFIKGFRTLFQKGQTPGPGWGCLVFIQIRQSWSSTSTCGELACKSGNTFTVSVRSLRKAEKKICSDFERNSARNHCSFFVSRLGARLEVGKNRGCQVKRITMHALPEGHRRADFRL